MLVEHSISYHISTGRGHVLIFSGEASSSQPPTAIRLTQLRNTTGECLRVYVCTNEHSYLHIYMLGENGESQQIVRFQSLTKDECSSLFIHLPSGLNHILLVGVCHHGRVILDDIEIGPCQHFYGMLLIILF